ncbi:hypothetical protein QUW49_01420 [Lacrimispora saccharolytica]|nr:hypothetical protein [Lachnospiraceae bacterium]MDM8247305.1 hypothetical protein [Lacrimispora saccharolytica]
MIDIHTHILPEVDDGSPNMDISLMMAEAAARSGVGMVAATCHSNQEQFENFESERLRQRFEDLQQEIARERIPVELVRGMEIWGVGALRDKIRSGRLIPLNRSRFYLVEVPFDMEPEEILGQLMEILALGKVPVLAHPERYYCVQDRPSWVYEWRMLGVLAQMNKGSIFGRFGPKTEKTAEVLLNHQMVNCIASDAHGAEYRTADLGSAREFLERHYSAEYAELLLSRNPEQILKNRLPSAGPTPVPVRQEIRWFW